MLRFLSKLCSYMTMCLYLAMSVSKPFVLGAGGNRLRSILRLTCIRDSLVAPSSLTLASAKSLLRLLGTCV